MKVNILEVSYKRFYREESGEKTSYVKMSKVSEGLMVPDESVR